MSRTGTAIFSPSDGGPCIDVFALSAGYVVGDFEKGDEVRHLHVLVDLSRTKGERPCTHELSGQASMVTEYCANGLDVQGACNYLNYLWSLASPAGVHVVVGLPGFSQDAQICVEQLLVAVRELQGSVPLTCVAVAADASLWAGVVNLQHFVSSPVPLWHRESLSTTFRIFSALSVPDAHTELDADDILAFTGAANRPGRIIDVAWFMEDFRKLNGLKSVEPRGVDAGGMGAVMPEQGECLLNAGAVLAVPTWSCRRPRQLVDAVLTELVPFVPPATPVTVCIGSGFWGPGALDLGVGRLVFLCGPPAA